MESLKKLGIVAGSGNLPLVIIKECKRNNIEPVCVLVEGFAKPNNYEGIKNISLRIGLVGKALDFFNKNQVTKIVFAGSVQKPSLSSVRTDLKGLGLLKQLIKNKLFGDNKVLETVVKFFEREGLFILKVDDILLNNKIKKGYEKQFENLDKKYLDDIQIGIKALKQMSSLDIGQSIVVQQGMVIGVECIEGTADLIRRCGELKYKEGRKPVLIKMKKHSQTKKADIPVIGKDTIRQLEKAGFAGIAIDSDNCLVLDKETVLFKAEKLGIFVIGV